MVRLDQLRLGLGGQHAQLQGFVRGRLAGRHAADLRAIDPFGKLLQGVVDLDSLQRHQHGQVVRPYLRGQVVAGASQGQFRVLHVDLCRGPGQFQLAAGDDRLADVAALVAGRPRRIHVVALIGQVGIGIGAGLNHRSPRGVDVGGSLPDQRTVGHGDALQLRQRQGRLARNGRRPNGRRYHVQFPIEFLDFGLPLGGRGVGPQRRQAHRRRLAARNATRDVQRCVTSRLFSWPKRLGCRS